MPFMIEDLLSPLSLPEKTESVSLAQTHISLVFIADAFVYKVKKAVNFGFLDFSTLEKRRYYCEQEVLLNRRLSRDLYIGVLPVTFDGKRHRIGGSATVVDYAVKMKRIPEEMLMKAVFHRGELAREHLKRVAETLSAFHVSALNSPEIDKFGRPEAFKINTDENFVQTEKYVGISIQERDFEAIRRWTNDFYTANEERFYDRIRERKIRDCHGDLHMEHICLTDNLYIFDCIEFNDRFRYSDSLSDIAFLLMDLEYHGGQDAARILWDLYRDLADESGVESLLTFYKVYRAYVRGKVTSFQLDDPHIGPDKKEEALQTAKRYFLLARSYVGGGD